MRFPFSRRSIPLFAFFVALLFASASQVHAIRVGSPNGNINSIFMLTTLGSNGQFQGVGTAANVRYPRCLVTARHVAVDSYPTAVVMGENLTKIDQYVKRQPIANRNFYGSTQFTDFAVVFAQNLKEGSWYKDPSRMKDTDYAPLPLGMAESLGLPPHDELGIIDPPPGEIPKPVLIQGYGANATMAGVPPKDDGVGILRKGTSVVAEFFKLGGYFQEGSYIRTLAIPTMWNSTCRGDSGGPLTPPAGSPVYGVASTTGFGIGDQTVDCANSTRGTYAAFDNKNATGGKTNWLRVNELVKQTCGKLLSVQTSGAPGRVQGSLSTPQEWPPIGGNSFDDDVYCGDGVTNQDCEEFMHAGQAMTLTAVPGTNSRFDKWSGMSTSACPCDGNTGVTCVVDYGKMGYYSADTSSDYSYCRANFLLKSSSSSSMSSSYSSSPGSSMSSSSMMSSSSSSMTSGYSSSY